MKIVKYWLVCLLLVLTGVLGIRLGSQIAVSDVGWLPLSDQWVDIAYERLGIPQRTLGEWDPADQARFWLREVEKCEQARTDPEIAIGAAWMLDSPQFDFIQRHFRQKQGMDIPGLPASWRRELDNDAITALAEEFELLCRDRCIAQIEKAIQLDPASPELQRARALMLFQSQFLKLEMEPRQPDWQQVLEECAQADPDNALYDYLAALFLWNSSARYEFVEDSDLIQIEDQDRYAEGQARLAAGLARPQLCFGREGYAATFRFLEKTSISPLDSLAATGSRQLENRARHLLYGLMRWKNAERDTAIHEEQAETAAEAMRHLLVVSEQITESGNTVDQLQPKLVLQLAGLAGLEKLHRKYPQEINADGAGQISRQLTETRLELEILGEAGQRMTTAANPLAGGNEAKSSTTIPIQLAVLPGMITPMLVVVCFALAGLLFLVSLFLPKAVESESVPLGWFRTSAVWIATMGISFLLLGMFPAEMVSPRAQTWLFCGLLWLIFLTAMLTLFCWLWRLRKKESLARRHRSLVTGGMIVFVLGGILAGFALGVTTYEMPPRSWFTAQVWQEAKEFPVEVEELQQLFMTSGFHWNWAFLQWQLHYGQVIAPVMAVAVLILWQWLRRRRLTADSSDQRVPVSVKQDFGQDCRRTAGSCSVVALIFLAVYFGSMSTVVDMLNTYYRIHQTRFVEPDRGWTEITGLMQAVRAEATTIADLQARVAQRIQKLAEQDARLENAEKNDEENDEDD